MNLPATKSIKMSISNKIILFLLATVVLSCEGNEGTEKPLSSQNLESLEPKIDANELQFDFTKWWAYQSRNISLSSNFIGLNEASDTIGKKQFLEKLVTENYIPLKLKSDKGIELYQLFKLDAKANKDIGSTIKNESLTNLQYLEMEGAALPEFEFIDLEGKRYTNDNTKGKFVILKTWFINCKACVAEFPELNELVEKYKQRKDIIFVSLAINTNSDLEKFLQKKKFEYKVIPNQKSFIEDKLNYQIYPTHLIVDKNGIVLKVLNKASQMIAFLEHEVIAAK